jgi:hypothetical protein
MRHDDPDRNEGVCVKKKLALMLATAAGAIALLVPLTSSAAPAACVVVQRGAVNLQIGYAPNGPDGCRHF